MRHIILPLFLLLVICGTASAEREKISFAATYGAFLPINSTVRDDYGSSFSRLSLTTFEPTKPTKPRFIMEVGSYSLNGDTDVRMIPVTFGVERGLKTKSSTQPYVVLRAGPYFGKLDNNITHVTDHTVGINANASVGIVFKKRFYAEARYDFFSKMAGSDFSGISLAAGVKLFDIRL
jgi:hypothetical protein